MQLNLTPDQVKKVTSPASGKITLADGKIIYYVPYWFTQNADGSWERMSIDELPEEAKKQLENLRTFIKLTCP